MAILLGAGLVSVSGCVRPADETAPPAEPVYGDVESKLLDADLLQIVVSMTGGNGPQDVDAYARCVMARDAVRRGFGYARQIRTNVDEEGGIWRRMLFTPSRKSCQTGSRPSTPASWWPIAPSGRYRRLRVDDGRFL